MKFVDLCKKMYKPKMMESLLIILMLIYIVFPLPLPLEVAKLVDTFLGTVVILVIIGLLFFLVNPLVGLVGLILGYVLLNRASNTTGSKVLRKYVPNEDQKKQDMLKFNADSSTDGSLEIQAVSKVPIITVNEENVETPYKPVYSTSEDYSDI